MKVRNGKCRRWKYKWVHYNCEQLNDQGIRWLKQLPETAYFEADGWNTELPISMIVAMGR